ncbi:MAG: transposase, partial [Euryarchaeota archaeon]|nr:transposase [Euryarchaeota archaeon]
MLNIFYNRDAETKILEELSVEEERLIVQNDQKNYETWLKEKISDFRTFLHGQELGRRRRDENPEQRSHQEAV